MFYGTKKGVHFFCLLQMHGDKKGNIYPFKCMGTIREIYTLSTAQKGKYTPLQMHGDNKGNMHPFKCMGTIREIYTPSNA